MPSFERGENPGEIIETSGKAEKKSAKTTRFDYPVTLQLQPDDTLEQALARALEVANHHDVVVRFEFEGQEYVMPPDQERLESELPKE